MLAIGDIHIYVQEFEAALRFWSEGLKLEVAEQEASDESSFARLDFPDGGPSLVLISPGEDWAPDEAESELEGRQTISFEVTTNEFESTLARLLERGGEQVSDVESYNELRLVTLSDPDGNTFELIEIPQEGA